MTQHPRLPRLFVGSSTESLDIAYAIQENLEFDAETTVWKQGIFKPTRQILSDLVVAMKDVDFAVFVFNADDAVTMRGEEFRATRDNVIFELGLFMGHLGVERCFFLHPRGLDGLRLPSDLLGLGALTFNAGRSDGNLVAALGTACNQLRRAMRELASLDARSSAPAAAPKREDAGQKLRRLLALWDAGALKSDRALVSQGMPLWIGDDEDGKATDAFTRICAFLNSVADTVLDDPAAERRARAVLDEPMRSVWQLARTYFVNFANGSVDDYWEDREFPPMKVLAERWGAVS